MRLILTADWHLGRLFHGGHLTGDQAHLLEQFTELVRDGRPDAVLIAGDVYDRAVPPPEAVELLDDVLTRLALDLKTRTVMIAGNHDSPSRLGFGSRALAGAGLHVFGRPDPDGAPVMLEDRHGPVAVHAFTYAEPAVVREIYATEEARDQQSAMSVRIRQARESKITAGRSIALAHAFVAGGESTESERPLSVGGVDTLDAGLFAPFQFTVLGHLHRPPVRGRRVDSLPRVLDEILVFGIRTDKKREPGGDGRIGPLPGRAHPPDTEAGHSPDQGFTKGSAGRARPG